MFLKPEIFFFLFRKNTRIPIVFACPQEYANTMEIILDPSAYGLRRRALGRDWMEIQQRPLRSMRCMMYDITSFCSFFKPAFFFFKNPI